jgi:hypothetical protein
MQLCAIVVQGCRSRPRQSDSDGWDRDGAAAPARPLRHWHNKKKINRLIIFLTLSDEWCIFSDMSIFCGKNFFVCRAFSRAAR